MVWVGVSVPSIGEFAPFDQRLRRRKGTGKQSADLTDLNIYYMEKRCPGLRAHAPTSSSGRAIFWNISLQKVAYRLPEKQKVLPRLKGWLCETRQTVLLYVFVAFFGHDCAQRSIAFLSFWTYWLIETSHLIHSVTICEQKRRDYVRSRKQRCLQLWCLPAFLY